MTRTDRKWLVAALLSLAGWTGVTAGEAPEPPAAKDAEPAWKVEIRGRLEKKISLEFVQASLVEALNFLQETADVNMVVDPAVKAKSGAKSITLKMQEASVRLALEWVLRLAELDYDLRDNAVFIHTPGAPAPDTVLGIYDVQDLLSPIVDHPAPAVDLDGRAGFGDDGLDSTPFGFQTDAARDGGELAAVIVHRIRPDSWGMRRGTSMEARDGRLVVVQRPEVHRLISSMLADLRYAATVPLESTVRFLAVAPDGLDDAGRTGRLLAEATAAGTDGQRVHAMDGRTWPPKGERGAAFTGAFVDIRPVLSHDRRCAFVTARTGLLLPAGPDGDEAAQVRSYRTSAAARLELGKPLKLPLGSLRNGNGETELVVAELTVRRRAANDAAAADAQAVVQNDEPEWRAEILRKMERLVDIDLVEQPLEDCIAHIRPLAEASIVTDPTAFAAGVDPRTPITIRLTKTRLSFVLKWVLRTAGLDYRLKDGAIFISTPDRLQEKPAQMVYDVRDFAAAPRQFPGPAIKANGLMGGGGTAGAVISMPNVPRGMTADGVADLIVRVIQPGTWGNGRGTAAAAGARVVVLQAPEVHREISALLSDLRLAVRPEVRVDAALYSLDPAARADTTAEVEKDGRLLTRLATTGENCQRLHTFGGTACSVKSGWEQCVQLTGALLDVLPKLSGDRKELGADLRLVWIGDDHVSARMAGEVRFRVGEAAVIRMGEAGGRAFAAVVRATVRASELPRMPAGVGHGEDEPTGMQPAPRQQLQPQQVPAVPELPDVF